MTVASEDTVTRRRDLTPLHSIIIKFCWATESIKWRVLRKQTRSLVYPLFAREFGFTLDVSFGKKFGTITMPKISSVEESKGPVDRVVTTLHSRNLSCAQFPVVPVENQHLRRSRVTDETETKRFHQNMNFSVGH